MADVYFLWEDHKAVERAPPHYVLILLIAIPREYTVIICGNKTLRRQVASYGYQSVLLTKMWIGKYVGLVIEKSKKHLWNLLFNYVLFTILRAKLRIILCFYKEKRVEIK